MRALARLKLLALGRLPRRDDTRGTPSPRRPLTGTVTLITGGARGIGYATAEQFAAYGATVVIGDLDTDVVDAAARRLGPHAVGRVLDVTSGPSFEAFVNGAVEQFGRPDVLVNNAGIQHIGSFVDEDDVATACQVAVNLGGTLTGTKLALAHMYRQRRGHIVNVSSVAGKVAAPGGATYSATKHAVVGLSEALRAELRDAGVIVSVVLPAIIATRMADGLSAPRGVKPVEPTAVAQAIVRNVLKRKSRDIYVPQNISVLTSVMSVLPLAMRRGVNRLLGADRVLSHVDRTARSTYQTRVESDSRAVPNNHP